jgi:hypothetical protein
MTRHYDAVRVLRLRVALNVPLVDPTAGLLAVSRAATCQWLTS